MTTLHKPGEEYLETWVADRVEFLIAKGERELSAVFQCLLTYDSSVVARAVNRLHPLKLPIALLAPQGQAEEFMDRGQPWCADVMRDLGKIVELRLQSAIVSGSTSLE